MAGETIVTICGNLVADPTLKFTPSGVAVAEFTVASTARTFDKDTNSWKDSDSPLFMRCSVWRQYAENVAESGLTKGTQVIVQGRLKQRSYQTKEGENRTVIELDVDDVGPTLRFATAKVTKSQRGSGSGGNGGGSSNSAGSGGDWGSGSGSGGVQRSGGQQSRPAEADPWATGGGQSSYGSEPPF
jgi:single-strand DNA-binding protein